MKSTFLFMLVAVVGFFASPVQAKTIVKVIQGKDTVRWINKDITFTDGFVDGQRVGPPGGYFQAKGSRAKFNSLIVYRKSFLKEMIKDAKKL